MDRAVHRAIVCVDVEGYTARHRTSTDQGAVRKGLYRALATAFTRSGISWEACYHEDRGDGVLVLIPAQIHKSLLVERFPSELAAALREHNRHSGPRAGIRLRLAVHAGELHHDEHGVVGTAVDLTFRLLDAPPLREALARSPGVIALIASPWFFEEVIRNTPAGAPDDYRRVHVSVKTTEVDAWIRVPDHADPPVPDTGPGPVPRQLPPAVGPFVGREAELRTLTRLLEHAITPVAITGTAGVGKTALAVHWAHLAEDRFPDGSLYVNLRGHDADPPMPPDRALGMMLHSLGVPAERLPAETQARAALFRSMLAGRRVLVVLDNAATAAQVRPLLPGTRGCMAVVTSRVGLPALVARDGAHPLGLNRLTESEAVALLAGIIGRSKVEADPMGASELAHHCACLPLALRIAAQRASTMALADVNKELAERRLDVLDADDVHTAVRTVFSWSYRALPPELARAFHLLGVYPGSDIGVDAAAVLLDTADPRPLLEGLTRAHLLEEARGRYRFHSLLRLYAAERAHREDHRLAVRSVLTWYLRTADEARKTLFPHPAVPLTVEDAGRPPLTFEGPGRALEWCDTEQVNLIALTRHAAASGHHDIAWKLPGALWSYFLVRKHLAEWLATGRISLDSVRRTGDRRGEAWVLASCGTCYYELRQYPESIDHNRRALELFRDVGDLEGQGSALNGLGYGYSGLRRFEEATAEFHRALTIFRDLGDRMGQGWSLTGLGFACAHLRRFAESARRFRQALIITPVSDKRGKAWSLHGLGRAHRGLRRFEEAIDYDRQAHATFQQIGDWWGQGETLHNIGQSLHDLGRPKEARQAWNDALAIFTDLGAPRAAQVQARLTALG